MLYNFIRVAFQRGKKGTDRTVGAIGRGELAEIAVPIGEHQGSGRKIAENLALA